MSETEHMRVRLYFDKTGRAAYISHLDLMRTLCRAFMRADMHMRYSEGYNPRPYLSIARPLSLGFESVCELCDIETEDKPDVEALPQRLNAVLPEGISVKRAVQGGQDAALIMRSQYEITVFCETDPSEEELGRMRAALAESPMMIEKRTKKGEMKPTDISTMIYSASAERIGEKRIRLNAVLKDAPDGSLNPQLLAAALQSSMPKASLIRYKRVGFQTADGTAFE